MFDETEPNMTKDDMCSHQTHKTLWSLMWATRSDQVPCPSAMSIYTDYEVYQQYTSKVKLSDGMVRKDTYTIHQCEKNSAAERMGVSLYFNVYVHIWRKRGRRIWNDVRRIRSIYGIGMRFIYYLTVQFLRVSYLWICLVSTRKGMCVFFFLCLYIVLKTVCHLS